MEEDEDVAESEETEANDSEMSEIPNRMLCVASL